MKKNYSHAMRKYMTAAIVAGLLLIVCSVFLLFIRAFVFAYVEMAMGAIILGYVIFLHIKRKEEISKYIHKIVNDEMGISENALSSVPLPMAVCSIEGTIRWYNDEFADIFNDNKLPHEMFDDVIPQLKWSEVLKRKTGRQTVALGDKTYSLRWCMLKDKIAPNVMGDHYSVFFYLTDITKEQQLETAYKNEKADIAVINIDNYDEFMQKMDDDVVENASSKIRTVILAWAKLSNAVIKKTDRDRYYAIFEHQYLEKYISTNFDIVESVRKISEEVKFPISLSMGIGTGGNLSENEVRARTALDMALGRGGGQVCIKDDTQFKIYGGKNKEYERSTRVKARAVALALREFIENSDNVIFMGHRAADYDCFGAAIGLQRAVRELGKTPYIVYERNSPAIKNMFESLRSNDDYIGMFVDENEVFEEVTPKTVLIVLDTHRPSMLPCSKLLDKVKTVVLIDHHRRSTEFISPCSLVYHEPYASSTCEMVTEILEYMNVGTKLTKEEAQCLYTGIIMDTKNFMLKTGVRTFEAASYLRKLGLDTVAVKRMFSISRDDYMRKVDIVQTAVPVAGNICIAKTYRMHKNMRVVASQAADEMLNLADTRASVVVYPGDGGTGFCARSLGEINVQLIMEKLGGGGHMTVAGAFINDISVDEGVVMAEKAIRTYVNETEEK